MASNPSFTTQNALTIKGNAKGVRSKSTQLVCTTGQAKQRPFHVGGSILDSKLEWTAGGIVGGKGYVLKDVCDNTVKHGEKR
jgi:hypothetical protein